MVKIDFKLAWTANYEDLEEYKGWHITHDYDESEGFDKIDRYLIWTANYDDLVDEEFKTKSEAKQWIDDNGEE